MHTPNLLRLTTLSLATLACSTNAGDDGNVEGFQLVEAEFSDNYSTLILTFSDPVAPVDGIAPTDFRISLGTAMLSSYDGETYEQSAYYEPNTFGDSYSAALGMIAIANGPGADQLSITLDPGFDPSVCSVPAEWLAGGSPEFIVDAGIFTHYAPGTTPVTNTDGVELAPIGPEWVLLEPDAPYYGYELFIEEFGFPNLEPRIEIPC